METPLEAVIQHQVDSKTGMLKAVTANYLTVLIENKQGLQGKTVDLIIKHCHKDLSLTGKIID